ncbi:signal peptidase II [Microvirga sp. BT350]|uniref:Lipoprotein signal peptidase n=1 Tax=Microvirga alba TaxID=2791025 RepID=A0A931BY37_9HYPH|nr:signal peptidase II [Microvirga alba]
MTENPDPSAPISVPPEQAAPQRPRPTKSSSPSKGGGKRRTKKSGLPIAAYLGFAAALIILILDQATKIYGLFIYDLPVREPVAFGPFINLIVVWNRGVSYGLFQQSTEFGRWMLVVISIVAAVGLIFWIRRTTGWVLAISLGLIVGGAIGNVIDRLAYGAVFDFIQIYFGSWSWYVFNVADAAIVAGVIGLLYDSFLLEKRRTR